MTIQVSQTFCLGRADRTLDILNDGEHYIINNEGISHQLYKYDQSKGEEGTWVATFYEANYENQSELWNAIVETIENGDKLTRFSISLPYSKEEILYTLEAAKSDAAYHRRQCKKDAPYPESKEEIEGWDRSCNIFSNIIDQIEAEVSV